MHCIVVPNEYLLNPDARPLGPDAAHHLRDVMRARPGDEVSLVDGRGARRTARVSGASRSEIRLEGVGGVETEPRPSPQITLFQCVAKPSRMDWLLEKAVETGVFRIVPVVSSRVVSRIAPGERPVRWQRIVDAALGQCGSAWGPELAPAVSWAEAMERIAAFPGFVFAGALSEGAPPVARAMAEKFGGAGAAENVDGELPVGWAIGPEGDFSPEELRQAAALPNVVPVSLGPRILRVETAAVFAVAVTMALLGPRAGNNMREA